MLGKQLLRCGILKKEVYGEEVDSVIFTAHTRTGGIYDFGLARVFFSDQRNTSYLVIPFFYQAEQIECCTNQHRC